MVLKYSYKWRFLGTLLKFDEAELDIIHSDCPNDSEECCMRLLSTWLEKFPDALWDHLLSAIDDLSYQGMILIGVSLYKHCTNNLNGTMVVFTKIYSKLKWKGSKFIKCG